MHTVNLLTNLVTHHYILAYIVIFLGLVFEGEFVLISVGILIHLGALNFWISIIFIFLGGLLKTTAGYALGKYLYKKFNHNKFFKYVDRRVHDIMPRFQAKPFWSIFISKFIIGVNYIVVLFSGYRGVNFRTYLKAEFFSTIIWAPLMLSLGYFFSYTALHISKEITKFSLIIILFIIGFFLLDRFISVLYYVFENLENSSHDNK